YAYLRLLNRIRNYVLLSIMNLVVGAVCNVVLLIVGRLGLLAMLWSSIIAGAFTAVFVSRIILRGVGRQRRFRLSLARDVIVYSVPLGFSGLGMFVLNFGDRYFLQRTVSLGEIGIYALAYKIGMLVAYLQAPFDTYWRSQMYAIMGQRSGEWL